MPKPQTLSMPSSEEVARWAEEEAIEDALAKTADAKGLDVLQDSPALNRILLRNARKSLTDIATATGIPTAEVSERLSVLLDDAGWRDDLMEEKLLLKEIAMLVDDIRERMARSSLEDEAWASMARVQLQAIKTLLEQVEKRRKAVDGKLALVTMMQAQFMAEAIKIAQEHAVLNIRKKYPELDVDIIYTEFEEALPGAIKFLEAGVDAKRH